ncbi:MAG TPA: response regulator, partial [Myxococcaceae bacterium]
MAGPVATVYVVDDDAGVRDALRALIRAAGLEVQTFASAQEVLDCTSLGGPSCLVLDVRLPGLSGLELQARMAELQR